jgi:hypothetical protein
MRGPCLKQMGPRVVGAEVRPKMEYDEASAEAKRQEIVGQMADALEAAVGPDGHRLAAVAAEHFLTVTAPYSDASPLGRITMLEGGAGGAQSVKPGNIVLNLRKLIIAAANGTITVISTMASPWLVLLGALVVWDSLWSCVVVRISEQHASVLWAMWVKRDERQTIAISDVPLSVNRERARFGRAPLADSDIALAIESLHRMRCIELFAPDPTRYWLREWVTLKYAA